jgi:hypothetical protein
MLSLLAQAAPAATSATPSLNIPLDDPRYFIVAAVLSVPLLVTAVNGILQIIKFFKPDPPVHREYATKVELREVKNELKEVETRLEKDIAANGEALTDMEERINQARGQMEDRLKTEISSVDEGLQRGNASLQNELKSIQRTLGQIEGKLDSKRRA